MEFGLLLFFLVIAIANCDVDFRERPKNFSLELLYQTAQQNGGNLVISPFGMWSLLTAIALGASGNSYKQLSAALILPEDEANLINGYKQLTDVVLNRIDGIILTSKYYLFFDRSFNVFPEFMEAIQKHFGAAVKVFDFTDPNGVTVTNSDMENTGGKVTNFLIPGNFGKARMILSNVVSFNGLWTSPFNTSYTVKESFYNEKGTVIGSVNMMYQKGKFPYSNVKELESFVLILPYGDDIKYSMLFILPYPKKNVLEVNRHLANFGMKVVFESLQKDIDDFGLDYIDVKIPRFHTTTNVEMNEPLNDMGVNDIFEPFLAKFKLMTDVDIFVTSIYHKADIEVTESGIVTFGESTSELENKISSSSFYANRPFVYFLIEKSTATVLFGGIYSKPTMF